MDQIDIAVVGAGFSGLYLLHRLRSDGWRVKVLEAGSDLGGTWHWNRYPGLRCDIESLQYSYSFSDALQREWHWRERYAERAEIHRYLHHVADRFDLERDIVYGTRVTAAAWDEAAGLWRIERSPGDPLAARTLIMATGALSEPNLPDVPGIRDFAGPVYHTGRWPMEPVDFTGLDVGVIGTGSSAIQSIPIIAREARSLTVFQRTANFVIPAWNKPLAPEVEAEFKANHDVYRETMRRSSGGYLIEANEAPLMSLPREVVLAELERQYRVGGLAFTHAYADSKSDRRANEVVADFMRDKIRGRVKDKALAEKLVPRDYPFGTKRLCVDTDYFETYNRPNVTLVDLRATPLERADATGLTTTERRFALDALVCATGFDAVTGALNAVDLRGRGGVALRDLWKNGPSTYLGLTVAGFPNLFTMIGPQSPSILSNVIVSIEQHVEWIGDCLAHLRQRGLTRIEAAPAAQMAWVERCNALAAATFYPEAASWYMGANVPGKPRVMLPFVGGVGVYREICDAIAATGYEGFRLGV
jgi:cyclohexanone monooxygenase